MKPGNFLAELVTRHPKRVTLIIVFVSLFLGLLAAVPSIWPDRFPALNSLQVDTDPENMLAADEPVRIFHNRRRKDKTMYCMAVMRFLNNKHSQSVYNARVKRQE